MAKAGRPSEPRRGHDERLAFDAQRASEGRIEDVDFGSVIMVPDAEDGVPGADLCGCYLFPQARCQPTVAFRPGEHRVRGCVGRDPGSGGKVMNSGPGANLGEAGSEIVAAAIVYIPAEGRGSKSFAVHPLGHGDAV